MEEELVADRNAEPGMRDQKTSLPDRLQEQEGVVPAAVANLEVRVGARPLPGNVEQRVRDLPQPRDKDLGDSRPVHQSAGNRLLEQAETPCVAQARTEIVRTDRSALRSRHAQGSPP